MRAMLRVLSFQLTAEDFERLRVRDLVLGLACTWIVGMGRAWDDPKAELAQKLGIGSLVYVGLLAAALWIVLMPLRPVHWTYRRVLTFVTLTSPPAILYSIPVERFWGNDVAYELNVGFLVVVALWRVAIVLVQLPRCARTSVLGTFSAVIWPISGAAFILSMLQMLSATVRVMGGLRDDAPRISTEPWNTIATISLVSGLALFATYVVISLKTASRGPRPPASSPALESPASGGRSPESKAPRSSAEAARRPA